MFNHEELYFLSQLFHDDDIRKLIDKKVYLPSQTKWSIETKIEKLLEKEELENRLLRVIEDLKEQ